MIWGGRNLKNLLVTTALAWAGTALSLRTTSSFPSYLGVSIGEFKQMGKEGNHVLSSASK